MPIGGFFPLLSGVSVNGAGIPKGTYFLDSGRSALALLLTNLKPSKIYAPYYLCDAAYSVFSRLNIDVEKYSLNQFLLPRDVPTLQQGEIYIFINYFGLTRHMARNLADRFGDRLIVDNTHDPFSEPIPGSWSFSNVRKSVGIPDGAILSGPIQWQLPAIPTASTVVSPGVYRRVRLNTRARMKFQESEKRFDSFPQLGSRISQILTDYIDSSRIIEIRKQNFNYLSERLDLHNLLKLRSLEGVPFCYPLLIEKVLSRSLLAQKGLYLPRFWSEIEAKQFAPRWERFLASNLLPLPIDHRYSKKDMDRIVKVIETVI